jgi:hypothetical protein
MRYFGTFWWLVLRRALRGSGTFANNWQTLGAFLLGLILWASGVEVKAANTLGGLLLPFAFAGLAWVIFFIARLLCWAPFYIWRAQKDRADALAESSRPRLHCIFDPTDRICVMEPKNRLREKMFTVRVTADGAGQIASCTAKLTSVTKPDGTIVPLEVSVPFGPSERHKLEPRDVVCGDKNYVNVLNVTVDNHVRVMTDIWPALVDIDDLFSEIGSYVIGFRLVSPDAPAVERTLELTWTKDWSTTTMKQL